MEAQVSAATLHHLIEVACLAPSVHNTQPWTWRIAGSSVELYADERRLLRATDPTGHNLVVSCGAALHHVQVAATALGWLPTVDRLPDGEAGELLARIRLTPSAPTPAGAAALVALRDRRTDRRRVTSWPVPEERLRELAEVAHMWGTVATVITGVVARDQVETLLNRAHQVQAHDVHVAAERTLWVDHGPDAGVPMNVIPDTLQSARGQRSRFGIGLLEDADRESDGAHGLIVLGSVADGREAWLRAGEALSALWLAATAAGLSVVPLSQIIEVPETREALQRDVLVSLAVPHVLVRIGWPATSRTPLPASPRRAVVDVLRP